MFPLKTCIIHTFHTDLISLLMSYYIDFKSLNRIVSYRHESTKILVPHTSGQFVGTLLLHPSRVHLPMLVWDVLVADAINHLN